MHKVVRNSYTEGSFVYLCLRPASIGEVLPSLLAWKIEGAHNAKEIIAAKYYENKKAGKCVLMPKASAI